jgi:NAD(P)-dependent dehydrogenase (short-subunit alcohol dehydrogenase family)
MEQKNALVTGAGRGIGRAIALELGQNGYAVGVNYLHSKAGAQAVCDEIIAHGGKAMPLQADVGNCAQLSAMFEEYFTAFGPIDLMVNNAGLSKFYPFLEVTEEQWQELTFSDWKGAFFGTQYAARNMVEHNKQGVIINISSNHVDGCWPQANIYGPTKAALTKFGKSAAMELAPYGIRVITVAPGYTDVNWPKDHPVQLAKPRIPLQRFAEPEEIAKIVAFLATDACSYMTGNCVTIDGGALLPILPENDYYGVTKP